jgi:5-formyltetrahydrofolate cyclo-ligase
MAPTYFVGSRDRLLHRSSWIATFRVAAGLARGGQSRHRCGMDETPRQVKKRLRAEALARRDALDVEWRIETSLTMARTAADLDPEPGMPVSGFWPMMTEVDVRPLMFALMERGAKLCLPAILDRETIVFRELVRGEPLGEMGFGTAGPGPDAAVIAPVLMLVPMAAFDRRGHRIGYGAGYYDRAIERLRREGAARRLVGIAFDCQEVETVPDQPHDVMLDAILTESGLRSFPLAEKML